MTDMLKLYPPPKGGRWAIEPENWKHRYFVRVALIVRPPGFFKSEYVAGSELVFEYRLRNDSDPETPKKGLMGEFPNDDNHVRLPKAELDKAIWEATRTIVRRYNDEHRPHEYTTEWETE